jgi:hypothetical protein
MSDSPKIYYHCYDGEQPGGGQKSVYQHVDVLNMSGYEAYAVHTREQYRLHWFENSTAVMSWSDLWRKFDLQRDFLVLPETMGPLAAQYPGKKIIFNKNIFYGCRALGVDPKVLDPYALQDTFGVMAVSDHNCRHLEFAYPHLMVCRVWDHIDSNVFKFRPMKEKKRQIVFVPSKSKLMLLTVYNMFRARACIGLNSGVDVPWVPIANLTERQTARLLAESMALVFTSVEEGLPRTPLEAMLCGCAVFAYSNGPLSEYLPKKLCFEYGDALGMVQALEELFTKADCRQEELDSEVQEYRRNAEMFTLERQRDSVCAAWERFFARPAL